MFQHDFHYSLICVYLCLSVVPFIIFRLRVLRASVVNSLFIAVFMLVMLAGCGPNRPETVPVRGTVTLDGKPVAGAGVLLMPKQGSRPATGQTDESGNFTLTTFEAGDGALLGTHAVTVTKQKVTGLIADENGLFGGEAPGGMKVQWLVPEKYSKPESSGFTVEVKDGMEPLVLELYSD